MKVYCCGICKIQSVSICKIESIDDGVLFFTKNNFIQIHSGWLHYKAPFGVRFLYPLSESQRNKVMKYFREN